MPFKVVKVKGGFKVKKDGTREYFSTKPLTKEMATKQMRAIYASENRPRKLKM
jgi:hypothetical protein